MKKLVVAAGAALFTILSTAALSQSRTFVSGVGDDLNPCSRTAPCKTFAGAINKTATNGEINCLDPAGYGTVNITKSITIDCHWTHGSILASSTNGIIVNATTASVIELRGLSINGVSTTTGNGIRILQAQAVIIDDVTIENIGGAAPSNGSGVKIEDSDGIRVSISNSRFYNVNQPAIHSIPTGGAVNLNVDNVEIARGGTNGIQLRQNTTANLNDVTVAGHSTGAGVVLEQSTATALISNSELVNNAFGVLNGTGGGAPTTRLFATVITGNTSAGLSIGGGSVISLGNNAIRGNTGNETPTQTLTPN